MRTSGRIFVVAAVVAFLMTPMGALASSDDPVPLQGSVLTVGAPDQMKTRNFLAGLALNDPYTAAVLARVYDTAVQRDPATGAVVPRLAVGEDMNGNGALDPAEVGAFAVPWSAPAITVFYDFSNARFHDGTPVTIIDVLFSYDLFALHPVQNGPFRVLMDRAGGAGSNFSTDRWLAIAPVDDRDTNPETSALRFVPQFPYADFPFATLGVPVFPRHLWELTGGGRHPDFGRMIYPEGHPKAGQGIPISETLYTPFNYPAAEGWQMVDADVIGSGHFRFATWSIINAIARLEANLDYAFGRPKVDSIVFKVYRSTQLGVLALQSGEVDFLFYGLPPEFIPGLEDDPHIGIVSAPSLYPVSMIFNARRIPFGYNTYPPPDRSADMGYAFRRAFQYLPDKATIVRALLQDTGLVANGMIAPTNDGWHNTSVPMFPYDPVQGGLVLDNAGWTKTGTGPCQSDGSNCRSFPRLGTAQFEILTPQADYDPIMASAGAMIADAARSIGVNARSRPTAFGSILNRMMTGDFDVAVVGTVDGHPLDSWTLKRGDPDYLFDTFHSSNAAAGANVAGFFDAEFDQVAEASRLGADYLGRTWSVYWAEGILADRGPAIPLYYRTQNWAYRADRFAGWVLIASTLLNYWSLQNLEPANNNNPPEIRLVSPASGAVIRPGTVIDLDVTDSNLVSVEYSIDATPPQALPAPCDIRTDSWTDGTHLVAVRAADPFVETLRYYGFQVDGTPPTVLFVSPKDGSRVNVDGLSIEVRFSEPVDRASAETAFSVVSGSTSWAANDGSFEWTANSSSFKYTPAARPPEGTTFEVRLSGNLTDIAGNPMGSAFTSRFTTSPPLATMVVFVGGIIAVVLALVLLLALLVVVRRRRRRPDRPA